MCHPSYHHRRYEMCGCGPFSRHFMSMNEEQKMLEDYKQQLEKELAGVKERIQELKNKQS